METPRSLDIIPLIGDCQTVAFGNKKPLLRKSAVQHYQNAELYNLIFFKRLSIVVYCALSQLEATGEVFILLPRRATDCL